jgi:NAD(P)-dependent dehydrogenase (short-subunit alcohol dehydrogenase family)
MLGVQAQMRRAREERDPPLLASTGRRTGRMNRLHQLFDLRGRIAIVTGGSRGLGLQIARGLGDFGATLALVARKQAELDEAVAMLREQGMEAVAFPCDLSDPDAPAHLTEQVLARFGRVDILVNNAGTAWGAPAEDYPREGWDKVMQLSLTGVFLLSQAVARQAFIPQGGGAILNIASIEGLLGHHPRRGGTVAYNAAKGGVINMTRALAAEWGPARIRVNALAPGFFPSKLTAATVAEHGAEMIDQTPLGKLGGEDDLMGAAVLLVSDAAGHITGQVLAVDGGATII